jgi:hypothetical protein
MKKLKFFLNLPLSVKGNEKGTKMKTMNFKPEIITVNGESFTKESFKRAFYFKNKEFYEDGVLQTNSYNWIFANCEVTLPVVNNNDKIQIIADDFEFTVMCSSSNTFFDGTLTKTFYPYGSFQLMFYKGKWFYLER